MTTALRLIAEIEDPRWRVGLEAPDSDELLYTRLGLEERNGVRNMAAAIAGDASLGAARYDCALMALDASAARHSWDASIVGSFLKTYARSGADRATGLQMASRRVLSFVKAVWLDSLTPPRIYQRLLRRLGRTAASEETAVTFLPSEEHTRQLFLPNQWFETPDLVQAWRTHYNSWWSCGR